MPKKTSWKGALCCHRLSEQLKQARAAAATMEIYGAVTVNRRNASICFNVKLAFRVHCEGVGTEIRPYMENKLDQQSSIKLVYMNFDMNFETAHWLLLLKARFRGTVRFCKDAVLMHLKRFIGYKKNFK